MAAPCSFSATHFSLAPGSGPYMGRRLHDRNPRATKKIPVIWRGFRKQRGVHVGVAFLSPSRRHQVHDRDQREDEDQDAQPDQPDLQRSQALYRLYVVLRCGVGLDP